MLSSPKFQKIRTLFLALFFILVGAQAYLLFSSPENQPSFGDFKIYYDSGLQAIQHQTVYQEFSDWPGKIKFKYSPFMALVFGSTLSQLPYDFSKWAFFALSLFAWIGWTFWICRSTQPRILRSAILLGLFLAFFANSLRNELYLGQANWISILLMTYFFERLEDHPKNPGWLWGSFLLTLAIQCKLYCVVGVFFLGIRKEWRKLLQVGAFTLLLTFCVPALFHGLDFSSQEGLRWFAALFSSSNELLDGYENVSVLGVASKVLGIGQSSQVLWFIAASVSFGIFWLRPLPSHLAYPYLFLFIILFNPLSWPYWILWAALPLLRSTEWIFGEPKAPTSLFLKIALSVTTLFALLLTNTIDRAATRNGGVVLASLIFILLYHVNCTRKMPPASS